MPRPLALSRRCEEDERLLDVKKAAMEGCEEAPCDHEKDILPPNITGQMKLTLNGEDVWGTEHDLGEDAYGAAAVALVVDVTRLAIEAEQGISRSLTLVRLSLALFLMVLNLGLQVGVLWYIREFVVEPTVRQVQLEYYRFHRDVFDEHGMFIKQRWDDYNRKDEVCEITMANKTFFYFIIFLWGLTMLGELRDIDDLVVNVKSVSTCKTPKEMLEFADTHSVEMGGRCFITGLTPGVRRSLYLFVIFPRMIISLCLLILGCRWLAASTTFSDMVLNSLALGFVIKIDELLYTTVLPLAMRKQFAETNFFLKENPMTMGDVHSAEWEGYIRTGLWMMLVIIGIAVWGECLQTVLPHDLSDVRFHCSEHLAGESVPICNHHAVSHGENALCYPFGGR